MASLHSDIYFGPKKKCKKSKYTEFQKLYLLPFPTALGSKKLYFKIAEISHFLVDMIKDLEIKSRHWHSKLLFTFLSSSSWVLRKLNWWILTGTNSTKNAQNSSISRQQIMNEWLAMTFCEIVSTIFESIFENCEEMALIFLDSPSSNFPPKDFSQQEFSQFQKDSRNIVDIFSLKNLVKSKWAKKVCL